VRACLALELPAEFQQGCRNTLGLS
jgi:hypothetical protein